MTDKIISCLPNAASLIESIRSIGYSFETALADIIDNSISAKANRIDIYLRIIGSNPYIQIIDDGIGMDNIELMEAMRLGSKNPNDTRDSEDLGRFGLGMKSASFSQVKNLIVISKKNDSINGYQWDLDLVSETEKFNIRVLSEESITKIPNINQLKSKESGTIVHWENFDRVSHSSNNLFDELSHLMNIAIEHISLIFHRFINNEKIGICVNNERIVAKDPFLSNHSGTQERIEKRVKIDDEVIYLKPYVLPHFSKLSASDQRLSGKVNEHSSSQGFYLYRNKRLIVWGDYLGLSRKTELGKNLRIQVDIPNSLDYLWEIDVKKSRANVPSKIKKNLVSVITDGEVVSKKVNNYRGKKELNNEQAFWSLIEERDTGFHIDINNNNELYKQFINLLEDDQLKIFKLLEKSLLENIPYQAIYSQIANGREKISSINNEDIITLREMILSFKGYPGIDYKKVLETLLFTEPYTSNDDAVKLINEELRKC